MSLSKKNSELLLFVFPISFLLLASQLARLLEVLIYLRSHNHFFIKIICFAIDIIFFYYNSQKLFNTLNIYEYCLKIKRYHKNLNGVWDDLNDSLDVCCRVQCIWYSYLHIILLVLYWYWPISVAFDYFLEWLMIMSHDWFKFFLSQWQDP